MVKPHSSFTDEEYPSFIQISYIICTIPLVFIFLTLQQFAQTSFLLQVCLVRLSLFLTSCFQNVLYERIAALTDGNEAAKMNLHLFLEINSSAQIDFWVTLRRFVKSAEKPRFVFADTGFKV